MFITVFEGWIPIVTFSLVLPWRQLIPAPFAKSQVHLLFAVLAFCSVYIQVWVHLMHGERCIRYGARGKFSQENFLSACLLNHEQSSFHQFHYVILLSTRPHFTIANQLDNAQLLNVITDQQSQPPPLHHLLVRAWHLPSSVQIRRSHPRHQATSVETPAGILLIRFT